MHHYQIDGVLRRRTGNVPHPPSPLTSAIANFLRHPSRSISDSARPLKPMSLEEAAPPSSLRVSPRLHPLSTPTTCSSCPPLCLRVTQARAATAEHSPSKQKPLHRRRYRRRDRILLHRIPPVASASSPEPCLITLHPIPPAPPSLTRTSKPAPPNKNTMLAPLPSIDLDVPSL